MLSGEGRSCIFKVDNDRPHVLCSNENHNPSPNRKTDSFEWSLSPQRVTRKIQGELNQSNQCRKLWHLSKSRCIRWSLKVQMSCLLNISLEASLYA